MSLIVIYSAFEVNSISEDEAILADIYQEQLKTIIFSVNQYTDDIIRGWANRIKFISNEYNTKEIEEQIKKFVFENKSVQMVVLTDSLLKSSMKFYTEKGNQFSDNAAEKMLSILEQNRLRINKLFRYRQEGYSKIEPLINPMDETPLLAYPLEYNEKSHQLAIMVLDIDEFINQILAKKIAAITSSDFIVSVFKGETLLAYTSAEPVNRLNVKELTQLWLLPDYWIGISIEGRSIESIIRERTIINTLLVLVLNIVVILGLWTVYRSIKKQIELAQLKSDFVSNVSHEIRTPLSLISMFAETLELGRVKKEEKKQEYYSIIRRETGRLGAIVNKILDFAQIEANKKKFHFEPYDLNDILDTVMDTYQFHLADKSVNFSINKDNSIPELKLDHGAISEVIINLIDNAVKYSGEEKRIEIRTGINDSSAFLEVEDFGIGISKENQKKIFDKFFRVSTPLIHDTKGNGLGLSLVKYIMDAHDGSIVVTSKLGKGSIFKIVFSIK